MTSAATTPAPAQLLRSVGFWGLAAMVLNGIVGAGIFAMPAAVAEHAGGWAPLIVLTVGLAMLPVVLVVARLAGLFDGTGGPILYVEAAFGPAAAFQIGWMQILSTATSAAANANVLADYAMRAWMPATADPLVHAAIVLVALIAILVLNLFSASGVARALGLASVAKLMPLALIVLLAVPAILGGGGHHPAVQWSLAQAALLSAYAFTGFEGALTLAGEAKHPKRDMPRAVIGVFVAVSLLYALLVWGYVATAYQPAIADKAPLSTMAAALLGSAGAVVMLATATVSIFGNVANNILFLSRRLLALEALGGLPGWFGRIHPASAVPRNAVVFIAVVVIALSLSGGFAALAILSVASRLIVYLGCVAALPVIARRRGLGLSTGGVVLTAAAGATCLALIAGSEPMSWLALIVAAAIGGLLYTATRYRRPVESPLSS